MWGRPIPLFHSLASFFWGEELLLDFVCRPKWFFMHSCLRRRDFFCYSFFITAHVRQSTFLRPFKKVRASIKKCVSLGLILVIPRDIFCSTFSRCAFFRLWMCRVFLFASYQAFEMQQSFFSGSLGRSAIVFLRERLCFVHFRQRSFLLFLFGGSRFRALFYGEL